jgi:hypothetical protein
VQKMDLKKKIKSTFIFISVFLCISCQGKIKMNQGGADLGNFSSLPIIKNYLNQQVADKGFASIPSFSPPSTTA